MLMKLCDLHIHSNNSFDAVSSVDELCKSAINSGLYAIAITDHCEAPDIIMGDNTNNNKTTNSVIQLKKHRMQSENIVII